MLMLDLASPLDCVSRWLPACSPAVVEIPNSSLYSSSPAQYPSLPSQSYPNRHRQSRSSPEAVERLGRRTVFEVSLLANVVVSES